MEFNSHRFFSHADAHIKKGWDVGDRIEIVGGELNGSVVKN